MKQSERPKINPPLFVFDIVLEGLAAVAIIYMLVQLIMTWPTLPEQVPTHFNSSGLTDDWGSKSSMLILPMVALVMYVGLTVLSRFPHIFNFPVPLTEHNAVRQYHLAKSLLSFIKLDVLAIFLYIQSFTIRTAMGEAAGLGIWFIGYTMGGTFIPIIIYFVLASRAK
jgi:uncharacterized membrane protein